MTHGERFYSTIALSYKLSYVQPKSKADCTQRLIEGESDSQIWVRVINQSAGKKKILLSHGTFRCSRYCEKKPTSSLQMM